jgi:hypothetical protein
VIESNNQAQSQRNYLPLLDISTNETKQQSNTLHIKHTNSSHQLPLLNQGLSTSLAKGLGIWHRSSTNHYCRLFSHLQSNTLELDDKAQTLSYEHYYLVAQTTTVVSFFTRVAIAFLLYLGLVFASNEGSAAIGVVVFVAEGLGFVI